MYCWKTGLLTTQFAEIIKCSFNNQKQQTLKPEVLQKEVLTWVMAMRAVCLERTSRLVKIISKSISLIARPPARASITPFSVSGISTSLQKSCNMSKNWSSMFALIQTNTQPYKQKHNSFLTLAQTNSQPHHQKYNKVVHPRWITKPNKPLTSATTVKT